MNVQVQTAANGTNEAEPDWWDELSPEEQKELETAIQESYDKQNWVSHEEATTMINQWLK
ncbi:MAG: hypothetical protein AAB316_08025 [Bacteroidota bacterium]